MFKKIFFYFLIVIIERTAFAQEIIDAPDFIYVNELEKWSIETIAQMTIIILLTLIFLFLLFTRLIFYYKHSKMLNSVFVHEVMEHHPKTIPASERLIDAVAIMRKNNLHYLPVVSELRHIEGLISSQDIEEFLKHDEISTHDEVILSQSYIRDHMIKDVQTLSPYANLADATKLMKKLSRRCIPIIDDANRVVGVLTQSALVDGIETYVLTPLRKKRGEE